MIIRKMRGQQQLMSTDLLGRPLLADETSGSGDGAFARLSDDEF